MSLRTRLKKLEATRRPVHVVDSWEDRHAACKAFGVWSPTLHEVLTVAVDGPKEGRPPTYDELREAGEIVETERYVALLRADAEGRARDLLDFDVKRWRSLVARDEVGAYATARPIRAAVEAPAPDARYRPDGLTGFMPLDPTDPAAVAAAQRHDGAQEVAAWAAEFEAEHPDAEALAVAWRDEADRREHERQRQIHVDAGYPDPGPWRGPQTVHDALDALAETDPGP